MRFSTVTPYLHDDADVAADWRVRVFGFEVIRRWPDEGGRTSNVELRVGRAEI